MRRVWAWNPQQYPVAIQQLLSRMSLPELGPGRPQHDIYDQLKSLSHHQLLGDRLIADPSMVAALQRVSSTSTAP